MIDGDEMLLEIYNLREKVSLYESRISEMNSLKNDIARKNCPVCDGLGRIKCLSPEEVFPPGTQSYRVCNVCGGE